MNTPIKTSLERPRNLATGRVRPVGNIWSRLSSRLHLPALRLCTVLRRSVRRRAEVSYLGKVKAIGRRGELH